MSDIFSMFASDEKASQESSSSDDTYSSDSYYQDRHLSPTKTFVLSIGGSLLINESSKPNTAFMGKLSEKISGLHQQGFKLVLVVGGGVIARNFIGAAKALGADNFSLDVVGIQATKLNASLLIQSLEDAFPKVLDDPMQVKGILKQGFIPVFSGIIPGLTTDAVAALIAEHLGAVFVNLTNVDGVYSSNPKDNPSAKMFDSMSYDRLLTLMSMQKSKPGQNLVLDVMCCTILKRSSIRAVVLNGTDLDNLSNYLNDDEFKGTVIQNSVQEDV